VSSPMAIRDTVARLISDVCAGKLHPRIAAGLATLMHLQLRVLEKTEIEKHLGKLERLMIEGIMENRKGSAAEELPEQG
jgi:hypothetical protein